MLLHAPILFMPSIYPEPMDDENAKYEAMRQKLIDDLKRTLAETPSLSRDEIAVFEHVIAVLESLKDGVDTAHKRIAFRKAELYALDQNMHELAHALHDVIDGMGTMNSHISGQIEAQNRRNRRFYVCAGVGLSVIIGGMAFVLFGSRETISILSTLTQALKLVGIIL